MSTMCPLATVDSTNEPEEVSLGVTVTRDLTANPSVITRLVDDSSKHHHEQIAITEIRRLSAPPDGKLRVGITGIENGKIGVNCDGAWRQLDQGLWEQKAIVDLDVPLDIMRRDLCGSISIESLDSSGDIKNRIQLPVAIHRNELVEAPSQILFGLTIPGKPVERKFLVRSTDNVNFRIKKVSSTALSFNCVASSDIASKEHWLTVVYSPDEIGEHKEEIEVITDRSDVKSLRILVSGKCSGTAVDATPNGGVSESRTAN